MIEARHLSRLAADERAAGLATSLRDASDDRTRRLNLELAGSEVVEEEQRLRPLGQEVVHAHGHKVDADGGVPAGVDGNLELGTNAVVGSNQDRIAKACRFEVEEGPKPPQRGVRPHAPRHGSKGLDGFHQGFSGIDVDPGCPVGNGGRAVQATWHGGARWLPTFAQRLTEYCRA
jgi:hypothetical protein